MQREKIKAAEQEKSLVSHITDKDFVLSLYRKLLPVDKKKQENISQKRIKIISKWPKCIRPKYILEQHYNAANIQRTVINKKH